MMLKKIIYNLLPFNNISNKIYKLYIKSHNNFLKGNKILAKYYSYKIYRKYNCYISPNAKIGKNLLIAHPVGIVIGDGVNIGDNSIIFQNVTLGRNDYHKEDYPTIGNNVTIYSNSVISGNVEIGDNCVIGCNSFVNCSFEDNLLIGGTPAKVIRKLENRKEEKNK